MLFTQLRCSSSTKFGIAAADAEKNGASARGDRNAIATSQTGSSANANAAKQAAPARSETIITVRRSNRSPSEPANGPTNPDTPNVSRSVAESHVAEPVRS